MTGVKSVEDKKRSDNIVLGGNIELIGFKDMDGGSMIILKKMVGNHVRKLSEISEKFEKLTVSMKKVGSGNNKFEISVKLLDNCS
jgi:transcriptional/translational regulatory protein YebC/TACO1